MTSFDRKLLLTLGVAVVNAAFGAPAMGRGAPDRFELGTNSSGDSCSASRQWTIGKGGTLLASDQPFGITCRGVSAAEAQGYVSAPDAAPATDQCGDAVKSSLASIGAVDVRRCFDARLARPSVDIRFRHNGKNYQGAALETTLGPLEVALQVAVGGAKPPSGRATNAKPSIDLAGVPAGPMVSSAMQGTGITAEAALTDGIAALQAGRMLDASRILNDALRAFATADAATRVDLRLAAGLADSNLSQFESADGHFLIAGALLEANPALADGGQKLQQLSTYRGLHLINQRRWADAIAVLQQTGQTGKDLNDAITLSQLNQEAALNSDALQSSLGDATSLSRSLLEAQRNWALSVAQLGLGQIRQAEAALVRTIDAAREPLREVAPERIVWLQAAIERQKGRIEVRKGNIDRALASFDCAIAALQGGEPRTPSACSFSQTRALPDTVVNAPLLVEAQLERASTASRDPNRQPAAVLSEYGSAVQSLANLNGTGYVSLAALERYFSLLTEAPASAARDEEYFRAMQTIGEPAIAREYAQLQRVVSANGEVADLLRQRGDLERQLIRLRYEIAASSGAGTSDLTGLENERSTADTKLAGVNAKLLAANGIGALEDQPATIASIHDALLPGEVYLKLIALRSTMFGIAINRDQVMIYKAGASLPAIEQRTQAVLASAHTDDDGYTRPFEVAKASELFEIIGGPATAMLNGASRIIYNPAGALRQLPLAILVGDKASVASYQKQEAKGDYSKVGFLGRKVETATALSPRAFLRGRIDLKPSQAPHKFLGLGENAPPQQASAALGDRQMPFDCSLSYNNWARAVAGRQPVSAREITIAADALGVSGAPEIIRADFTDANLVTGPASEQLSQYQILHFATHGIPETSIAVDQCVMHLPPSLITTLIAPQPDSQVISDGLLSFDEVARLRLNANLVVLSACETFAGASTDVARRRGLEESTPALDGLVRSFIVANARSVMATFWRVPAIKQSDDLMASFYSNGRTSSISTSLRAAQNLLMDQPRYSHPYYWGAYFLVGDGSKMMLTPNVQTTSR